MVPINMRFDSATNVSGSGVVHFPKLNQGAPYNFGLRVRHEDDTYRIWDTITEMRWAIKERPADKHALLTLYKSAGNFSIDNTTNTLSFVLRANDWDGVKFNKSVNHLEMDIPFTFVVEFLDADGVVVERFAQGSGFITANLGL